MSTRFRVSGSYRPHLTAPKQIAMWAVVLASGPYGRDYTINQLHAAGYEKIGCWIPTVDSYVGWLQLRGYASWEEDKENRGITPCR